MGDTLQLQDPSLVSDKPAFPGAPELFPAPKPAPKSRGDQLDASSVLGFASGGFQDPIAGEAFAATVYQHYFNFPPGLSLADMTRIANGTSLDGVAAGNFIKRWFAPVEAKDDPYDEFNKLSREDQVAEVVKEHPAVAEQASPQELDSLIDTHKSKLKGKSLKYRILDGESGLPNSVVAEVRLAMASSNKEKLAYLVRSAAPEDRDKIANLGQAYADAYQKPPLVEKGGAVDKLLRFGWPLDPTGTLQRYVANKIPVAIDAVKGLISKYGYAGSTILSSPNEGIGLHGTIKDLGIQFDTKGAVLNPEKVKTDWLQMMNSRFGAGTPEGGQMTPFTDSDAQKFIASLPEQAPIAQKEYETAKSEFAAEKILSPSSYGKSPFDKGVDAFVKFVPELSLMAIAPELSPVIGGLMTSDLHRSLVFDYGLSQSQANAITIPASIAYAFGGELIPKFGSAGEAATKVFAKSVQEGMAKLAKTTGGKLLHTELALQVFGVVDTAAKSAALTLTERGKDVPEEWRKYAAEVPQMLFNGAIMAGAHFPFDAADHMKLAEKPVEKNGDPGMLKDAEKQEEGVGLDPNRQLGISDEPLTPEQDAMVQKSIDEIMEQGRLQKEAELHAVQNQRPGDVLAAKVGGVKFDDPWHPGGDELPRWQFTDQQTGSTFYTPEFATQDYLENSLAKLRKSFEGGSMSDAEIEAMLNGTGPKENAFDVALSANTGTIPALARLQSLATSGDASAGRLLSHVAVDSLTHLTENIPSAKVEMLPTVGLYGGSTENGLGVRITFDDADRGSTLAALAKFSKNFNQEQLHVREAAPEGDAFGTKYEDGTVVSEQAHIELKRIPSRSQLEQVIKASGLYGLTLEQNKLLTYFTGDTTNEQQHDEWLAAVAKGSESLRPFSGSEDGQETKGFVHSLTRLGIYGDGERAIPYDRISGDVQTGSPQDNATARRIASRLAATDITPVRQGEVNPAKTGPKVAEHFGDLKSDNLADPRVRRSYEELATEIVDQAKHVPVKVESYTGEDPYKNSSAAMRKDILDNNHLYVLKTDEQHFGPDKGMFEDHPLLRDSGLQDINGKPLLVNDVLRYVHDYFAHAMSSAEFGPKGEEAAWRNHMAMTKSPWARWALTTETRGQNSFVNYGPNAEHNRAHPESTVFAEQKVDLLPIQDAMTGDPRLDREMQLISQGKEVPENKFVTRADYDAAVKSLKEKLSRTSSGVDPTILKELSQMLVYHVEKGVRTFAAAAKLAVEQFGEGIKPYIAPAWDDIQANHPAGATLRPAPKYGDAAIELATRLLREDGFTADQMKNVIEANFPNVPIQKTIDSARMLAAGIGDATGLSETAITKKLRQEEINQRVNEQTAQKIKDLTKTARKQVGQEAIAGQRVQAEDALSRVSGTDYLSENDKPRTVGKTVTESFRQGFRAGEKKSTPLNTIAFQAVEKKDSSLKITSRENRQASYEDDLGRINTALSALNADPLRGEKTATAKMDEMFGGQEAKDVRRLMHDAGEHKLKSMFENLQNEYHARLKGMFAEDIVRSFLKLKEKQASLTPTAIEALTALRDRQSPIVTEAARQAGVEAGDFNFHIDQLTKLTKAKNKLKMYQDLLSEAKITPEQYLRKSKLVEGFKSGMLEFFKSEPFGKLQELRNELARIEADSRQEQYNIASGKLRKKTEDAAAIKSEAEKNAPKQFHENDTAKRGMLRDLNVDPAHIIGKIGGVGIDSRSKSVLHDLPFVGRNIADAEKSRLHDVYEDGLRSLGVSEKDRIAWGTDRHDLYAAGQTLNATTMELLHLRNNLKSPWTENEAGKTKAIKSVIDRSREYGWKPVAGADSVVALKDALESSLTDKQKAVGDLMFKIYNDPKLREDLNRSSMWKRGIAAYTDEAYTRLLRDRDVSGQVETLDDLERGGFKSLEGYGSGKARVTNKNAILLDNAEQVLMRHIHESTRQAHLLIPLGEAKSTLSEPSTRSTIIDRIGRDGLDQLLTAYADLAGVGEPVKTNPIVRWLTRGQMTTALWGNFLSMANARAQAEVLTAGMLSNDYGAGAAAKYLARSDLHLPGPLFWKNGKNQAAMDALMENGYFLHRWKLQPMEILSQLANPGELGQESAQLDANAKNYTFELAKHYGRKIEKWGMQGYQNGDAKAAVGAYRYLTEVQKLSTDDAIAKVTDYVRSSQPPSSPMDYTKGYKALRPFWLLFPFMGAESRSSALLAKEATRYQQAGTPADRTAAVKRIGTVALSLALQAATATAVARAGWSLRTGKPFIPDEDDKTHPGVKILTKAFSDINAPIGRFVEMAADLFTRGELRDLPPIQNANDLYQSSAALIEAWHNDELDLSDPDQAKKAQKMMESLGSLARLPLRGIIAGYQLVKGLFGGNQEE